MFCYYSDFIHAECDLLGKIRGENFEKIQAKCAICDKETHSNVFVNMEDKKKILFIGTI